MPIATHDRKAVMQRIDAHTREGWVYYTGQWQAYAKEKGRKSTKICEFRPLSDVLGRRWMVGWGLSKRCRKVLICAELRRIESANAPTDAPR